MTSRLLLLPVLIIGFATTSAFGQDDLPPIVTAVKDQLADPAKPFTMFVRIPVKAGQEKAFESAFAVARGKTRKEPGCLTYELTKLAGEKPIYVVYERWKNLDALIVHAKSPYITTLLNQLPQFADGGPELQVGVPAAEE